MYAVSQSILKLVLGLAAFLLLLGLSIGSTVTMPDYAIVFLDDENKTYVALPCVDEWRNRPSTTFAVVRRATAGEARRLNYQPDGNCRDEGGFVGEGRSLAGMVFVRLGLLPPLPQWWDAPYRTEDGTVVWPRP
jgi:hypothetical protein